MNSINCEPEKEGYIGGCAAKIKNFEKLYGITVVWVTRVVVKNISTRNSKQ